MSKDLQSIEDLMAASKGQSSLSTDDESTDEKFKRKQRQIKIHDMERVTKARADAMGIQYFDLFGFPIGPEGLSLIDEEIARKLRTVCFYYNGSNIRLATMNPESEEVQALLKKLTEELYCEGQLYLMSENSFKYALKLYKAIPKVRKFTRSVEITEEELGMFNDKFTSFKDLQAEVDKAQVSDIVTMIMAASMKSGSSDIHVEAEENGIKIRFRIDGVLQDAATIDRELWKKIISRLKVLSAVKINITDRPQDGRMTINTEKERVDIRVSFLPTNYGESVVMRLLRSSSVSLGFDDLGIRGRAFKQLKEEISRPNGMIITTGPTGSGKTTTLYSILKKLNGPETKIITVEDPIEYQLEGINQSQTGKNYTFAQGLRSIVRQDPDVIMIGEIRDLETAEIAIQASLTGHLVLSTIHTNDAAGTVPRFLSMGAKPFLLAPALNAMIGQRLIRKNCEVCKEEVQLDEETMAKVVKILEDLPEQEKEGVDMSSMKFFQGKGCEACQGIGYKGRVGIYEIMIVDEEVQKVVLSGNASEYDMRNIAKQNGMIPMVADGILKALDGMTSVEEVFRVAE